MKFTIFVAIFLFAELAFGAESDVVHLGDSDFESFIKDNPAALVAFTGKYKPLNCKNCVVTFFLLPSSNAFAGNSNMVW